MYLKEWYDTHKEFFDKLFSDEEFVSNIKKYGIVQSFSTLRYCLKDDICKSKYGDYNTVNTNKDFKNFFQRIYHAGSTYQFIMYSYVPNNIEDYVRSMFYYLFTELKKGIYVTIKDNNIVTYLPFSNAKYYNTWGDNLRMRGGDVASILKLAESKHRSYGDPKYQTMIQRNPNLWYANCGIFRNTIYKNGNLRFLEDEGDKSVGNFLELITEVCYKYVVPDVSFFISPRDHPVLKYNRYHPYDRLYPLGNDKPNYSNLYSINNDVVPVFSQSVSDEFEDTMIPNDDDIVGLLCNTIDQKDYNLDWYSKKSVAVFRGSATGFGTTPATNKRLKLYELSKNNPMLDVELIGLNEKLKVDDEGYVTVIDRTKYPEIQKDHNKKHSLSPLEQSNYKYIIHVEGNVAAFRLTRELGYGSLILKVDSRWKTWYSDKLVGWRVGGRKTDLKKAHYLVIDEDYGNLQETLDWCVSNDDLCKQIVDRSLNFFSEYLSNKDYMLHYMYTTLLEYGKKQKVSKKQKMRGLIVIPYRDDINHTRRSQLETFVEYYTNNLKTKYLDMYVSEDTKYVDMKFNRGRLLNEAVVKNNDYDYYILHDVDLLPDEKLIKYYHEYPLLPIHLGYRGQRWSKEEYDNKTFVGGVLSISKYDYYLVNGFPNDYWGWGGEDDSLLFRLKENGIKVTNPDEGSVIDIENMSVEDKLTNLRKENTKNNLKWEKLKLDRRTWFKNGVRQIPPKLRILVIVAAGDNTLHEHWLKDIGNECVVDVVVNWYSDKEVPKGIQKSSKRVIVGKGPKWQLVRNTLKEVDYREYDYIWIPDDDLMPIKGGIVEMCKTMYINGIKMAQPSLLPLNVQWKFLINIPSNDQEYRRIKFIEIQAPCFSVHGFDKVVHTIMDEEVRTGWGLDYVWADICSKNNYLYAVLDNVVMEHTRPPQKNKAGYQGVSVNPYEEMDRTFKKYNYVKKEYVKKEYVKKY